MDAHCNWMFNLSDNKCVVFSHCSLVFHCLPFAPVEKVGASRKCVCIHVLLTIAFCFSICMSVSVVSINLSNYTKPFHLFPFHFSCHSVFFYVILSLKLSLSLISFSWIRLPPPSHDCISTAPFHVKHAQLHWTSRNNKKKEHICISYPKQHVSRQSCSNIN